jgi:hypothetical protein
MISGVPFPNCRSGAIGLALAGNPENDGHLSPWQEAVGRQIIPDTRTHKNGNKRIGRINKALVPKAGIVGPSVMLEKLAPYSRQRQLDLALQEFSAVKSHPAERPEYRSAHRQRLTAAAPMRETSPASHGIERIANVPGCLRALRRRGPDKTQC